MKKKEKIQKRYSLNKNIRMHSDHRDGICIVTKEQNAKGMDSKTTKIDKWLGEIGF